MTAPTPERTTMNIAFAGTGFISKIHAQAARNLGLALTAVVNHRPESRGEFAARFAIARQYDTLEALLQDGGVDALVVSTPNYLHAPQTIAALNAGVHVMVEKPMAMNAAEAAQMNAAAAASGALLMVAHCWRFDPEVLWLKGQSAKLGRIIRTKGYGVHAHWGPGGWFIQKRYAGGGALADMGIHALDTARFLLGDPQPVSVYARIGTYYKDYDVDDTGVILVEWDTGATSYIESGWWQPHSDGVEAATQLYGAEGFGQLFPTKLVLPNQQEQRLVESAAGFEFPREEHCPQSLYDDQLRYFVGCVANKQQPSPGGREGLINMQMIDAAYQSARTGEVVKIVRRAGSF
jgi:predicted dehydrogenase